MVEQVSSDSDKEAIKPVVTVWEQFGAGAADIGRRVAQALGLPFHEQAFSSAELEDPESALDNRAVLSRVLSTMGGAYGGFEGRDVITTQREKRDLVVRNNRAVLQSADEGGVILGRNATVILATRPHTLHVLLTGDVDDRIDRAAADAGISRDQAKKRQVREDDVRAEMSRTLYGWDPHSPERYDLVLNTSRIPAAAAVAAIVNAIRANMPSGDTSNKDG